MLIIFTPDGFFEDLTRRWDTYVLVAYWNNLAVFVWFRLVLGKTSPQQKFNTFFCVIVSNELYVLGQY